MEMEMEMEVDTENKRETPKQEALGVVVEHIVKCDVVSHKPGEAFYLTRKQLLRLGLAWSSASKLIPRLFMGPVMLMQPDLSGSMQAGGMKDDALAGTATASARFLERHPNGVVLIMDFATDQQYVKDETACRSQAVLSELEDASLFANCPFSRTITEVHGKDYPFRAESDPNEHVWIGDSAEESDAYRAREAAHRARKELKEAVDEDKEVHEIETAKKEVRDAERLSIEAQDKAAKAAESPSTPTRRRVVFEDRKALLRVLNEMMPRTLCGTPLLASFIVVRQFLAQVVVNCLRNAKRHFSVCERYVLHDGGDESSKRFDEAITMAERYGMERKVHPNALAVAQALRANNHDLKQILMNESAPNNAQLAQLMPAGALADVNGVRVHRFTIGVCFCFTGDEGDMDRGLIDTMSALDYEPSATPDEPDKGAGDVTTEDPVELHLAVGFTAEGGLQDVSSIVEATEHDMMRRPTPRRFTRTTPGGLETKEVNWGHNGIYVASKGGAVVHEKHKGRRVGQQVSLADLQVKLDDLKKAAREKGREKRQTDAKRRKLEDAEALRKAKAQEARDGALTYMEATAKFGVVIPTFTPGMLRSDEHFVARLVNVLVIARIKALEAETGKHVDADAVEADLLGHNAKEFRAIVSPILSGLKNLMGVDVRYKGELVRHRFPSAGNAARDRPAQVHQGLHGEQEAQQAGDPQAADKVVAQRNGEGLARARRGHVRKSADLRPRYLRRVGTAAGDADVAGIGEAGEEGACEI